MEVYKYRNGPRGAGQSLDSKLRSKSTNDTAQKQVYGARKYDYNCMQKL